MLNLEIFKKEIRQNYKSVRPKVIRICYNIHIRGDFMHSNDDKREWIDLAPVSYTHLNHLLSSLIMTYVLCVFKKNLYSTIRGDNMAISMAILSGIVVSVDVYKRQSLASV